MEDIPDPGDIAGPAPVSEKAVVADAVLAFGEHMNQEPADELVGVQRHGRVSPAPLDAIILDAEGHAARIGAEQAAVRDGDTVRLARQIAQHGLGPGERLLGVVS